MEKLVKKIKHLVVKNKLQWLSLSGMEVEFYRVSVHVSPLGGEFNGLPRNYHVDVSFMIPWLSGPDAIPKSAPADRILPDELRRMIIEKVKWGIDLFISSGASLNEGQSLGEYLKEVELMQDNVEKEYTERFLLSRYEIIQLHRFHSPMRIPRGYTEQEIKLCVSLISLHDQWMESYPVISPPQLDQSLFIDIDKDISRTEALKNAIFKMLIDLANRPKLSSS